MPACGMIPTWKSMNHIHKGRSRKERGVTVTDGGVGPGATIGVQGHHLAMTFVAATANISTYMLCDGSPHDVSNTGRQNCTTDFNCIQRHSCNKQTFSK